VVVYKIITSRKLEIQGLCLKTLAPQYGNMNKICHLMPCLCMRSNFEPSLCFEPCSHTSHSLLHYIVFDAIMRMGISWVFISPFKISCSLVYKDGSLTNNKVIKNDMTCHLYIGCHVASIMTCQFVRSTLTLATFRWWPKFG
jgi:hypothetical protein